MPNIIFYNHHGSRVGVWPGRTVRIKGVGPRKQNQIYLGKVIDEKKLIFWTRERGYYTFNPEDQSFREIDQKDLPPAFLEPDGRKRENRAAVDFGDVYFLDSFIHGIGYDQVIDAIEYQNRDSLYAAIAFYTLERNAGCHADSWCRQNYAGFLYPRADLKSERFSSLLASIEEPEKVRSFLLAHIKYLENIYGEDLCILIDSTGFENECDLTITSNSKKNGDVNIEFRLIVIVQKSTGIPFFYEYVPGNIVDGSTIKRIINLLNEYGCHIQYSIADSGYYCPSTIENLVLSDIEFMSKLNQIYTLYKKVIKEHIDELDLDNNIVRFKN